MTASVIRLVDGPQLRSAVRFEDLIEPVATAFEQTSAGLADNGLIVMFPGASPDMGDVYVKTGTLRGHPVYVVKVAPWFADNARRGLPQGGFVAVFDSRTGHTVAILNDDHYLSDIRTAAAGAVAARALAPNPVATAAVLGSGVQAYWQPLALYQERPFGRLDIWARDPHHATALLTRLQPILSTVDVRVSTDLEATVRAADVLITATSAREPLVRGAWLRDGQHITAVGADDPTKCELDADALRRSRVIVDDLATTLANGDVYRAIQRGEYRADDVAGEIGQVLAGARPGRTSAAQVTIAKLVGLGALDLVAAEVSLRLLDSRATATGCGSRG